MTQRLISKLEIEHPGELFRSRFLRGKVNRNPNTIANV